MVKVDLINQTFTQVSSLSIDEMQIYAEADSVKSFYYTSTISLNGTDEFEAISTTSSSSESSIDSMMESWYGNARNG